MSWIFWYIDGEEVIGYIAGEKVVDVEFRGYRENLVGYPLKSTMEETINCLF